VNRYLPTTVAGLVGGVLVGGAVMLPRCPDAECVEQTKDMQQASPFPAGTITIASGAASVAVTARSA
jgi:carbon starvation protein CstA